MRMPIISRVLFVILGLFIGISSHVEDYFTDTHLFNPLWPPHAKFHCGQTLAFSILLSILTVWFACRKTNDKWTTVLVSSSFSMLYWIAQGSAALYPNTAFTDPQFAQRPGSSVNGIPIQLIGEFVCIALTVFSGWLALRPGQNWQANKPADQIQASG